MKVFISWSGALSHAVAEVLHDWLKCVLQGSEPWLSSRDIDRGALWFTEINNQLKDTSVGIICLTQENKNKPWLLFEAGALAKGLSSSRVCTLLVDLVPAAIGDPLAQFNHTLPDKNGIKLLVLTLNSFCLNPLEHKIVERVFETYWKQFESAFQQALKDHPSSDAPATPPTGEILLQRIYEATTSLSQRLARIEEDSIPKVEPVVDRPVSEIGRDVTFNMIVKYARNVLKSGQTPAGAAFQTKNTFNLSSQIVGEAVEAAMRLERDEK